MNVINDMDIMFGVHVVTSVINRTFFPDEINDSMRYDCVHWLNEVETIEPNIVTMDAIDDFKEKLDDIFIKYKMPLIVYGSCE